MATCKGCGKSITYHDEWGKWVPYNHPEGGRHHCDAYQKAKQDQDQSQKAPEKAATGPGEETPPQGGQSTGQTTQPPPAAQEKATGGPPDKDRLIVLQSSLKVAAMMYDQANHTRDDYDLVVDRVLTKAIEITERIFQEART